MDKKGSIKTKQCYKCKQIKSVIEFGINHGHYRSYCNKCNSRLQRIYISKNHWKGTYKSIIQRCENKKHISYKRYKNIKVKITPLELKELWFRDKAYLMKKPSIDRKSNKGDYVKSNCRYMELSENVKRGKKYEKSCKQLTLKGKLIKTYKSRAEASRQTGIQRPHINSCILGKRKTAGGYKWIVALLEKKKI